MSIETTGVTSIDQATAEIAVALRDASPGKRDQHYYDEAARLRDEILRGAGARPHLNTDRVRHHSSDDMHGVGELTDVFEPVAVVLRPDGSVDAYGYLAVIDQRAEVASLPLAVRAPEIGELLARLPRGEWGSGELGTLANWLAEHGYDIGDEEEVMTMTDDYTGYKPCGHPEYRNTDAGPQPNDCGCDQGDSDN